jgi:heme/flavin dehydrogenase (mycofactocin system)
MSNEWFETVAVAQRRAKKRLPKSVYWSVVAGSEQGTTLKDNVAAFGELGFTPHAGGLPAKRDLATTVLGQPLSMPVICSPTGVQAVHPDGEVAVARAAANRGTAVGLSSFGSKPVEEVVAANPKTFFQVYWIGGRAEMETRVERARAAGAVALIATVDWTFDTGRDWGSPKIPERMDLATMVRYAPQALVRPRWLARYARTLRPPDLRVPNMVAAGQPAPTFFGAYAQWAATPPPTWDDVAWLAQLWGGPFLIKGITRVNHGGNDMDGTPATIRALPAVAAAVGGQVEVLLDGGIRRGGDVVKALALGAKAVMIGRAYLWGLADNGQAGVENVLDILRGGTDSALLGLGKASVRDLTPDDLVVPPGFTRTLGGDGPVFDPALDGQAAAG